MLNWKDRLQASGIHLGISLVIAAFMGWFVFGIWYVYPYREISGGSNLFMLVIAVDVIVGPLITLIIFNKTKPKRELAVDIFLIFLVQLSALFYGMWTVYSARPVYLVFEYQRLAVVSAVDIHKSALPVPKILALAGPTLLSLRPFKDANEQYISTMAAINGVSQAAQPMLWQSWEAARTEILQESRSLSELKNRFSSQTSLIDSAIAATGRPSDGLRYLPLITRKASWTVLIDARTTLPVGFLPINSLQELGLK